MGKQKVAILGGGHAALTAAFQLTHPDNPRRDEYEVTVYQIGWRLGGKAATGRNTDPACFYRLEQRGLHDWLGFFENAFRQLRDCYTELGRDPDAPLATWCEAVTPVDDSVLIESIDGAPEAWRIETAANGRTPGDAAPLLPLDRYLSLALEAIERLLARNAATFTGDASAPDGLDALLARLTALGADVGGGDAGSKLLRGAQHAAALGCADPARDAASAAGARRLCLDALRLFMPWLWARMGSGLASSAEHRRSWILVNFGYAAIAGAIDDGIFEHGFAVVNQLGFHEWIGKHQFADGGLLLRSPILRAVYDATFAYVDGDRSLSTDFPANAQLEAGTALHCLVRALFTYQGAFRWRFIAGPGDACYAPMYQVLKARGVNFAFFHRVDEVVCGSGPDFVIEELKIARQVEIEPDQLREGGYQPFVDVKGLACWPHEPLWDQLVNGDVVEENEIDLENPPRNFRDAKRLSLKRGVDFDVVVLGISVAALPWLCPTLLDASERWRAMSIGLRSVRTGGAQLWLKKTPWQLGWRLGAAGTVSWGAAGHLQTWADVTGAVRSWEGWSVEHWPSSVARFDDVIPDEPPNRPDMSIPMPTPNEVAAAKKQVRKLVVELSSQSVATVWPAAVEDLGQAARFEWELLVDARPGHNVGQMHLDSQWLYANVALSDRSVLSVPGSSALRVPANDAKEFPNLYVAGDWTACHLNVGCIEAATMSGMLCSLALSGWPARERIVGVDFG